MSNRETAVFNQPQATADASDPPPPPSTIPLPLHSLGAMDDSDSLHLSRDEINRMILEYLVIEGYKDVAEKFSRETGITETYSQMKISGETIDIRMTIRKAVLNREIEEVIKMVNNNWPELFDTNPVIYFKLRQLQMLDLIRSGPLENALLFAQTYLYDPIGRRLNEFPQLLNEMQHTMALLAFEDPTECVYGKLLGPQHVEIVAGALNRAILNHIEATIQDPDISLIGREPIRSAGGASGTSSSGPASAAGVSSAAAGGITTSGASVPRLTKMMAMLLHFRDITRFDLPPDLFS